MAGFFSLGGGRGSIGQEEEETNNNPPPNEIPLGPNTIIYEIKFNMEPM
jgi:hypothetical protein